MAAISDDTLDEVFLEECTAKGRGERYQELRKAGNSPKFAAMLAMQKSPQSVTDVEFFRNALPIDEQFGPPNVAKQRLNDAIRKGAKPGRNDVYLSQLARFPNDPEAFVPPTGGRGYVKKLLEQRGWESDGKIKTKRRESPPPKDIPLGEDIIRSTARQMIAANPDLKPRNKKQIQDMREQIIERHGQKNK